MMSDDRVCESLTALFSAERASRHLAGLGIIRDEGDHYVLTYVDEIGMKSVRPRMSNLPATLPAIGAVGAIEVPLPRVAPPARLVIVSRPADNSTADPATWQSLAERAAELLTAPEASASAIDRLRRFEAVDALLPALFSVLDVRDIFERVSLIAKEALPHDAMALGLFSDDGSEVALYAHTSAVRPPTVVANPYPVLTAGWRYTINTDLAIHPMERDSIVARDGARSSLNLAIWLGDRLLGGVSFFSPDISRFTATDLVVGRKIADVLALALSHQRLAEESQRAAALRERAYQLELLDGLLDTLAGVLDVREVFDRVSDIAQKALPHDGIIVIVPTDDAGRATNYAVRGFGDTMVVVESRVREPELLTEAWDSRIYDDLAEHSLYQDTPAVKAGMHAALLVPVRLQGRLQAFLSFLSRQPARFTRDDVMVGRRIANHIALALSHERLAEEGRRAAALQERTAKFELLDDLLTSVTGAGELPDVFDRVSRVAQKVLPHDTLVLTALLPDGRKARVYASTTRETVPWPAVVDVPPLMLRNPDWEFDLVDDLQARPDQRNLEATTRGLRGALRVPIRLDGEYVAGVSFLSFTPSQYSASDIPVARRIADRLALSFLRERGHEASRRADEASARAASLESRVRALTEELDARTGYRRVLGESMEWRHVLTQATQVAATDTTVLLLGESGTGKEVVARFVHRASSRTTGPFIALNCAALPEQLLEAELFGYERGAFTGATQSKPGQLEQAAGGTLFLDEVGEMSPSAQAKFLRVLQEREFQRLGGTRVLKTDARVVAATNRDLQRAIQHGGFREDLFYRLNVFAIRLPPLRDRRADVLPMSEAFLKEYGRSLGRPPSGISRDARQLLLDYHWPGNVRELRNILERAAILCDGGLITTEHLAVSVIAPVPSAAATSVPDLAVPPPSAAPASIATAGDLQSVERTMIVQALEKVRFNKSKAAQILGLTRAQLYVRMKRYGLE